jgi:diadenosine tetraphosphate (Ap4A) HIT family hydrolase
MTTSDAVADRDPGDDQGGCVVCDMLAGRIPLPGGLIHQTAQWCVMHVLGTFGLGALAVVPLRHVVHTADLNEDEAGELGVLLRDTATVVSGLTDPVQVYTCQWSHTGGNAAHIHFILQPIRHSDMEKHPGRLGPALQVAMFDAGNRPDSQSVDQFAEKARQAFSNLTSSSE